VITKNKESLSIDGVTLELYHWSPAHTSGDLVVYLPIAKIVFTGDIIAVPLPDPLIHLAKNGSSEGWDHDDEGSRFESDFKLRFRISLCKYLG
jgi:glyoxylase-like metal-dependent hydrolase (beta-lactamase superfamily II)